MSKTVLAPLTCPNCEGEVVLDKDQEFGFCKYCGTKVQNVSIKKIKGKVIFKIWPVNNMGLIN